MSAPRHVLSVLGRIGPHPAADEPPSHTPHPDLEGDLAPDDEELGSPPFLDDSRPREQDAAQRDRKAPPEPERAALLSASREKAAPRESDGFLSNLVARASRIELLREIYRAVHGSRRAALSRDALDRCAEEAGLFARKDIDDAREWLLTNGLLKTLNPDGDVRIRGEAVRQVQAFDESLALQFAFPDAKSDLANPDDDLTVDDPLPPKPKSP